MKIYVYQALVDAGRPFVVEPRRVRDLTPDDGLELAAAALRYAKQLEPDLDLKHVRRPILATAIWRATVETLFPGLIVTAAIASAYCTRGDNHPFRK